MDNVLAIFYLLLWIVTFCWYQWKQHIFDGGSVVILSYIIYAVFSLITLNDELFSSNYNPLKLFPYLYLYTMLMIALSPCIQNHLHPVESIEQPNTCILSVVSILAIVCVILLFPTITNNFQNGLIRLFIDSDAGKDAYAEQIDNVSERGSAINNIPAIIFNALSDIVIFLLFYFLTLKKKNIWIICGLGLCIVYSVLDAVMNGRRGPVISCFLTILLGYMFFKQFMPKKVVKRVRLVGIIAFIMASLPVIAITSSRFSESTAGVGGFFNWYVGQGSLYFNNYGLNAGGTRNGDRILYLAKRLIDSDTPKNFMERRVKYHNLDMDDDRFTTFVGDICIDFGPYLTVIIFVVCYGCILIVTRTRGKTQKLHQSFLIYFTLCICMQGGMSLFPYADTANIRMLAMLLFYAYLRYHEVLEKKFPLISLTR